MLVDLLKQQPKSGEGGFQTKHNCTIKAEKILKGKLLRLYYKLERNCFRLRPYTGGADIDTVNEREINNPNHAPYIERLLNKIQKAREEADFVVFCLHCGGQYNDEIGLYTQYIHSILKGTDVDLVVGTHPHCVLGNYFDRNRLFTYSLGNFSFTPGEKWYVDTVHAQYAIVLNMYIDESTKKISKYTYSIVKNVVGKDGISRVYPITELKEERYDEKLKSDVKKVTKRFTGKSNPQIRSEYLIKEYKI